MAAAAQDIDPEVAAAFNGVGASSASAPPSSGDLDPEVAAAFQGVGARHAAPSNPHANTPHALTPTHPQTQFQKAPAPDEPELSWGQTLSGAAHNALPDAKEVLGGIAHSVMHPIQTAEAIGDVGKGLISKVAGAAGVQQDADQKAKTEHLADTIGALYKSQYGSGVKGFKKAIATAPVSTAMDLSAPLTLGGGALADAAGVMGRVASIASKVGEFTDPIQLATKIAKLPIKGVVASKAIPAVQSFFSGAPIKALTTAAHAGSTDNPALRAAFESHLNGTANSTDIVDTAQSALDKLSKDRGAKYVADKAALTSGELPPIGWQPINDALKDAHAGVRITDPASGASDIVNEGAADALDKIQKKVDFYQSQPSGSVFGNLTGFDALKRSIGDIRNGYKNDPVAYQKATQMYNAVLDTIGREHPEYADAMKSYATASDQLDQIKGTFGIGKRNANDESVLRRILNTKTSGNKQNLLSQLAEKEPTLPYMIAGHELNPVFPGGIRQALNAAAAPISYGANPLLAATQGLLASPRIMGSVNNAAGKLSRLGANIAKPQVLDPLYYAGRAQEQENGDEPSPPGDLAPAAEAVWSNMLHRESPNGQWDKNGKVVISPKGAVGAAQIMPGTGPGAAALAGEKWDLNRLSNDEAYNLKLGHALFKSHLEEFGGDTSKAAAAYNSNPKAVHRAERMAALRGGSWTDYLPTETKAYASAVAVGNASGGRISRAIGGKAENKMTHEHLVERLMKLARAAKKGENAKTESLLKVPDAVVVKALEVAQQAI